MTKQPAAFPLRLPPDLMAAVRGQAQGLHRTVTKHIAVVLRADLAPAIDRDPAAGGTDDLARHIAALDRTVGRIADALHIAPDPPTSEDISRSQTAKEEVEEWRERLRILRRAYSNDLLEYYAAYGVSVRSRSPAEIDADRAALATVLIETKRDTSSADRLARMFAFERDRNAAVYAANPHHVPPFEAFVPILIEGDRAWRPRTGERT